MMGLLIQKTQKASIYFDIVNLDEFCIGGVDKDAVIKYYLGAIEKHGENNVRLFEVKEVKITRQADF
jgi:hypothetical protein